MTVHLVLYSRSYCHLCQDMLHATTEFSEKYDFDIEVIDVDADPALLAQYDELVPVLAVRTPDGSTRQICHYFLDVAEMHTLFSESRT